MIVYDKIIIILSMKTKTRPKQKERHQLIFKYLKSITPFNPNPETEFYLQRLRGKGVDVREKSMLLSPRVYDIKIAALAKSKKRVSFAGPQEVHNATSSTKKGNSEKVDKFNAKLQQQRGPSPEQVRKELSDLQSSVFSIFKIKPNEQINPSISNSHVFQSNTFNIQSSRHHNQSTLDKQRMQMNQSKRQRAFSASTFSKPKIQPISRLKLQSSISSVYKHQPKEQIHYSKSESKINLPEPGSKYKINSQDKSTIINKIQSVSSITSNRSQLRPSQPSSFTQRPLTRSNTYSQQSHNLMVEIFKHKLKTKIG